MSAVELRKRALKKAVLGFKAKDWALFNVAIQPGAILAIVVLYWRTFWDVLTGLFRREVEAWRFVRNLMVAFIPAVVLGLALVGTMLALGILEHWMLVLPISTSALWRWAMTNRAGAQGRHDLPRQAT